MRRVAIALALLLLTALVPLHGFGLVSAQGTSLETKEITAGADAYSYYYKGKYYKWYSYHKYKDKYELAVGNSSYYQRERAYLRFNLSSLPENAEIESAQVCVYVAYIKRSSPKMNVGIYATTNDWNEKYTKPAPEPGELLDSKTFSKGWVCFNVTDYVKANFPGQKTFSFVLKLVKEDYYNYAWIYSRENGNNKPVLKVTYASSSTGSAEISSLAVDGPLYQGTPTTIRVGVTNGGNEEINVTLTLKVNDVLLYSESINLGPGNQTTIERRWVPPAVGEYTITAELVANGTLDVESLKVRVYMSPYRVFQVLAQLYARWYGLLAPQLDALYANFTATLAELNNCSADLSGLSGDIKLIEANYNTSKAEYAEFMKVSGRSPYAVSAMVHARRAYLSARAAMAGIEKVKPVLLRLLTRCKASETPVNATPSAGEVTNQTESVTTNATTTSVLIDLSHGQYYFTRYGLRGLKGNIEKLGWNVSVGHAVLTYDRLKKYDVVILANPKRELREEEIAALRRYVEEGGALFVAGDWYKYLSGSLNELLEGTGVQFEKTELMDREKNSGKPYYPFVGIYNRDCSITKFIPENWKIYYNGDTLSIEGNAKWIIRGYESSYAVDASGKIVHEKGSKPVVAAAVTFGKGRIVVYGSSKALSDAYYGKYIKSNWPFIKGALLWLVGES